MVAGARSAGKRVYRCQTVTLQCRGPRLAADDLDAKAEAAALVEYTTATHASPACPRRLLERVRNARLQLAALATSFGSGELDHADFLSRRRYPADDLDQASRDLTAHNRLRILALHPSELAALCVPAVRRAVVRALLPFDQTAARPDAPRGGEAHCTLTRIGHSAEWLLSDQH